MEVTKENMIKAIEETSRTAEEFSRLEAENEKLSKHIKLLQTSDDASIMVIEEMEKENENLRDALTLILNENFSGKSTISAYACNRAEQALKEH